MKPLRAPQRSASFLVLLVLAAAGCSDDSSGPAPAPGAKLFSAKGCVACHGAQGQGTFMGPPLQQLTEHWKREDLARFFTNPAAATESDARLKQLSRTFRTPMAPIVASESDRLALADFVLGLK